MTDCIFKHDPPRQDCSQCVSSTTPPKPSALKEKLEKIFRKAGIAPKNLKNDLELSNYITIVEPVMSTLTKALEQLIEEQCIEARIHELQSVTYIDGMLMTTLPETGTLHSVNDRTKQLYDLTKGKV